MDIHNDTCLYKHATFSNALLCDLISFRHEKQLLAKYLEDQEGVLETAVLSGCVRDVEFLIEHEAPMELALRFACTNNETLDAQDSILNVAKALIRLRVDVNDKDGGGRSFLMHSAMHGLADLAALLLRHGADANTSDTYGMTALWYAVSEYHHEIAEVLLEHKSFYKLCPSSDDVAFITAAVFGDISALQALVVKDVDVNLLTNDGRTALFYAAEFGHADAVQLLIDSGANVAAKMQATLHSSRECETPLTLSGRAGNLQVFEALIRAGVPVNVRSGVDGVTPLISAARFDYFPAVSLLIAHGGDLLRMDDVQDDEFPLLPGSLATIETMCATIALEFEPLCARIVNRLLTVCSKLQHEVPQKQQEHQHLLPTEPEAEASVNHVTTGASVHDTIVTFASMVFRVCALMYDIQKKGSALTRFIASRAIVRRVHEMDDALDEFVRMQGLTQGVVEKCDRGLQTEQLQLRFEQSLSSDDTFNDTNYDSDTEADFDSYSHTDIALLLKNELLLQRRDASQEVQADFVESVLTRFLHASKIEETPDVPIWFITLDDVEYHHWNIVSSGNWVDRHEGTWRGTKAMIASVDRPTHVIIEVVARWYSLNHPNVVKFFGACHMGNTSVYVSELMHGGLPLHEFLHTSETNRARTWQCLYDAALGLQYMHSCGVTHRCLQGDTIIVGSDFITRLNNVGEHRRDFNSDERSFWNWCPPEYRSDYAVAAQMTPASDIYSFGMCIFEAVTLEVPWKGLTSKDIEVAVKNGQLPKRPAGMRDDAWTMINDMCTLDPDKRVTIEYVVHRLKVFANEQSSRSGPASGIAALISANADGQSDVPRQLQHVKKLLLPASGMSIELTFKHITTRCKDLPDAQWILANVLPALQLVFGLLQECDKTANDEEVVVFDAVMTRLWQYMRTVTTDRLVYERMRSRKAAESHRLVYAKLDELLDLLYVPVDDAIRVWKYETTSSIIQSGSTVDGFVISTDGDSASRPTATNQIASGPITLNLLGTAPANHVQWTQAGLAQTAATVEAAWRPVWYLSLRELVYSESDKIGQGAFGAVYKGRWRDTPVVIKFMGYDDDFETISTDLLLHEVRVWHRLNHPHVLKFYGASHVDKRYFVCELAGKGELSAFLKKPGNKHLVWHKLHEVALGLQYLHDNGVAHNDLKGDNIMVADDGSVKLIDFGMSALLDEAEIQVATKSIGAENWRSPEYLASKRPSYASDVYSFAMCIIEAVSGEMPWGGPMIAAQIKYQWRRGNKPPLRVSMTPKQRNLIDRMAVVDPTQRASLMFVVNTLNEIAQDSESANRRA